MLSPPSPEPFKQHTSRPNNLGPLADKGQLEGPPVIHRHLGYVNDRLASVPYKHLHKPLMPP